MFTANKEMMLAMRWPVVCLFPLTTENAKRSLFYIIFNLVGTSKTFKPLLQPAVKGI